MTRQTSIDVYREIKEQGLISKMQFEVYDKAFEFGPITQGETWDEHFSDLQRHTVAPRFAEMKKIGILAVVGKRKCRYSGRICEEWDVTSKRPVTIAPTKSKDKIIAELQAENKELRKKLGLQERKPSAKQNPLIPMRQAGLFNESKS